MQTSRTRTIVVSAATLALVLAGTVATSAHPGDRDEWQGRGLDRMGMGGPAWDEMDGPGLGLGRMGGPAWDEMDGPGLGLGRMGPMGGIFHEATDGFVRTETTYLADDGVLTTRRTDQGTVSAASEASLDYTLASGETATVATDADTQVISLSLEELELGNSGRTRQRLVPESMALADIPVGATVVVWAESQADGTYLAERVVVQAADDAADASDEAADAEGEITEVPASPLPADA